MKYLLGFIFCMGLTSAPAQASEGFIPSQDSNTLMLKGLTEGYTAFILNTPSRGKVLVSQVHVLKKTYAPRKLQWGYDLGWFYVSKKSTESKSAFRLDFEPEILWQNEDLDIVVMKLPAEILAACQCQGYDWAPYQEGNAKLIGYPMTTRRIYPQSNRLLILLSEIFGTVTQTQSSGRAWKGEKEYLADMDVLPGNSGGALINDQGQVIGILHEMKSWYGEGYRYMSPALDFTPVEKLIHELEKSRP